MPSPHLHAVRYSRGSMYLGELPFKGCVLEIYSIIVTLALFTDLKQIIDAGKEACLCQNGTVFAATSIRLGGFSSSH